MNLGFRELEYIGRQLNGEQKPKPIPSEEREPLDKILSQFKEGRAEIEVDGSLISHKEANSRVMQLLSDLHRKGYHIADDWKTYKQYRNQNI